MKANGPWVGYAWGAGAVFACTLAGWAMTDRFDLVNIAMVYLLAVVLVALRFSRGPAVLASVLGVAAFDVLFVPPRGTFAVDDVQYLLTFAIMVAVALVISHLVEGARRQARQQAALEIEAETERIRSTLLASISHDLRTPLAVLEGASSTLAQAGDRLTPEERSELVRNLCQQSREMSDRVAKLLQMTRLESGTIRIDRDWASIAEIVSTTLARLEDRLGDHRVLLEVPVTLPLVRIDAALIEQVVGNLLENAAKHTPPGTVVRVRAHATSGELVVTVEDYGGGVIDADVERIFRKFHHGTVEGAAGGVGLGLAICRAIVRLHGGRAWAERVPAGGMAFRFTLPVEQAPPVPDECYDQLAPDDSRR